MKRILIAVLAFFIASQALAAGVGYLTPGAISQYKLDSVSAPLTNYVMVKSADPCVLNPYFVDLTNPVIDALYQQRYGPCTTGPCVIDGVTHYFKAWAGPGNEVKSVVFDGLRWWWTVKHGQTWTGPEAYAGPQPTDCEATDVQTTNDASIWRNFLIATAPGFSPTNRDIIHEDQTACGLGERPNGFWPMTYYYDNQPPCGSSPAPFCGDGHKDPGETCVTCPQDSQPCLSPPDPFPCFEPKVCELPCVTTTCPALQAVPPSILTQAHDATTWVVIGSGRRLILRRIEAFLKSIDGYKPGVQSTGASELKLYEEKP